MAGAQAAQEADTPQEAEVAVTQAVEQKAQELKVTLDPAAARAVGREVISQLEAMGAFRQDEPEPESDEIAPVTNEPQPGAQVANPAPEVPKRNWIQRLVSDD